MKKRIYFETEKTVTTRTKGWIDIEVDYTQIYHNVFEHTVGIQDKWAIKYLLWIMPQASEDNMIPHGKNIISKFLKELEERGITTPSVKTIQDAITELVKNKLIVKYANGLYQLNPEIFWTTETKKRIEAIKEGKLMLGEDTKTIHI